MKQNLEMYKKKTYKNYISDSTSALQTLDKFLLKIKLSYNFLNIVMYKALAL